MFGFDQQEGQSEHILTVNEHISTVNDHILIENVQISMERSICMDIQQKEINHIRFYFPMIENKTEYVAPELPIHYDSPRSYDLDEADVKLLARLLWSSPLREERQKKALAWVVINRIGVSPYGDTLSAVINKTEFTFLDRKAHVSEENKRIATEALNAYYSIKSGLNIKRPVSASGVKIQFVGDPARYIRVLDKDFNVVWDGTER